MMWTFGLPPVPNFPVISIPTLLLFRRFGLRAKRLRSQLSKKTTRNSSEAAASELIHRKERELRDHFLGIHVQKLYDELTDRGKNFLRVEELVTEAARRVPGLVPDAETSG